MDYDQEQSVVGRCITGSACQLVGSGRTREEIVEELRNVAFAARGIWREMYGGSEKAEGTWGGVPVVNQPGGLPDTKPSQKPAQPAQKTFGAPDPPWPEDSPNNRIKPYPIKGHEEWLDKPLMLGKNKECVTLGKPWAEVTYREMLQIPVELDEKGNARYDSDWSYLGWMTTMEPKPGKWQKAEINRIARLKGIMAISWMKRDQGGEAASPQEWDEYIPEPQGSPF